MRLNEIQFTGAKPIEGYGPGFFRVGGEVHEGPILCAGADLIPWAGLSDPAPLEALAGRIDVLLLGMGAQIAYAPKALRDALDALGLGLEAMDSPAACRTYNVLLSEGRRVAVALIPV